MEEDDDAYVTSNDFGGTPERPTRIPKPVERFGEVGRDDEEELYGGWGENGKQKETETEEEEKEEEEEKKKRRRKT